MDSFDFVNNVKVLCEIIIKKHPDLLILLRDLKLSSISNPKALSENIMENIRNSLIEWDINIQSFENITSEENALETMYYLIETIQNDNLIDLASLQRIKEELSKDIKNVDKLYDCFEAIPDFLAELSKFVDIYKNNIDQRISIHKSLKVYASDLYIILSTIKRKLMNFNIDDLSMIENLQKYMKELLVMSIIVTNYPPRTIKKGTNSKIGTHFKAMIGCLIESERLFSQECLHVHFLTEDDFFLDFISNSKINKDCKIIFDLNITKSNSWELKNMVWTHPLRHQTERRKTEKITNNKAIIAFQFEVLASPHLFNPFTIKCYLFSDTVISIVHTNQEIDALITLFWDDYFRIDRTAFLTDGRFKCHEHVLIEDFTEAISKYFEKETSRELTPSNKDFLNKKLFKSSFQGKITLHQFGTQTMQETTISFGNWIMSLIKLLKISGTNELWKDGFIDGFMKKEADGKFVEALTGTFALRFSEKNIKIGVLLKMPNNSLEAWNPFSADECRNRTLCERLMEFHELKFIRAANGRIYKKEVVLSKYIQNKELDEGYTERGQLSKILCSNIYSEPLHDFDDDTMVDDIFIGSGFSDDNMFETSSS